MSRLKGLLSLERWVFKYLYWRGRLPWDTNTTPPEVLEFLSAAPPGRALDLGCGTGTNVITLAQHGWRVTGVDFAPRAIRNARRKAARAGVEVDFRVGDVLDLGNLSGPFDYVLDIGCLHSLRRRDRARYAERVARLTHPGSHYMVYAWLPRLRRGKTRGLSPQDVTELFSSTFQVTRRVIGTERGAGSAWYWLTRKGGKGTAESLAD